jgi:hypothetical protein
MAGSRTFVGHRANAELVPKFHVTLHVSHAALPTLTPMFRISVAYSMLTSTLHHMLLSHDFMFQFGVLSNGPVWKAENAAVGFDVLTTCQPSTVWCSRERLPAAAAQPAKVRQSCSATDLFYLQMFYSSQFLI